MSTRWLARAAFGLVFASAVVLIGFAGLASLAMVAVATVAACLIAAGGYWFLAHRGVVRWLAFGLVVLVPAAVLVVFALHHLIWVAAVSVALLLLAAGAARLALTPAAVGTGMPFREVPPPKHAFLIMNPRSGGGKVAKFGLKDKAEALGAEVALLEGPGVVDVADLARRAVAAGADLLGVAGGDGTQALVAGIAADHDLPFLVISAGTRNHFAMDLGLDRDDPAACLDALTSDGVEQRIDLGIIGDRTFVNNASFGAYAEVVENPAYRDDKRGTTLQVLPDLLSGHCGAKLTANAADTAVIGPQALLVSNDPYEMSDIAGLGRRARLDAGTLGVVAVTVSNTRQAVELLRGTHGRGLTTLTADQVVVDADVPEVPVGIDGETVMMPTPVRCTIRPKALRVRVPRDRPGARPPKPELDWRALRQLGSFSRQQADGARHRRFRFGWRGPLATLLIFLGCVLAPLSVAGVWAANQISDTDRYVANVAPLISDPAIQRTLTDKLSSAITAQLDIEGLVKQAAAGLSAQGATRAGDLLGGVSGPVASGVNSFIHDQTGNVVASPQVARLWEQANRTVHAQMVKVLSGQSAAITVVDGQATLNLGPIIDEVKKNLADQGLTIVNKIPPANPTYPLFPAKYLEQAQNGYQLLNTLKIVLPILTVVFLGLGVYVAKRHRRALIGAGLGVAASMLVLAAFLMIFRGIYLDSVPTKTLPADAAAALYDTLVRFIKTGLRMVLVVGLLVAIGAFFTGPSVTAVKTRAAFTKGLNWIRGRGEKAGLTTGPVGRWTYTHRAGLRIGALGLAALIFIFWSQPTAITAIVIAGILLLMLGLIQLIGRPPRARPASHHG